MSEVNNEVQEDLNEGVSETVDESQVITVPIDSTLTHANEAADAKAVGDALAAKANSSELAFTVNGQAKSNNNYEIYAGNIKVASGSNTTVAESLETLDNKTAEDIMMSDDPEAPTVYDALSSASARDATIIPMEEGSTTSIADAIDALDETVDSHSEDIGEIQTDITEISEAELDTIFTEVFGGEA